METDNFMSLDQIPEQRETWILARSNDVRYLPGSLEGNKEFLQAFPYLFTADQTCFVFFQTTQDATNYASKKFNLSKGNVRKKITINNEICLRDPNSKF